MSELVEEETSETTGEPADDDSTPEDAGAHLDGLESGAGCTEIWERLSEQRNDD